ncbi:MAG: sigma-70 family RNA polymerase sigma factor [Deltaproteobacteria bacterium]|nr:sigma-70 family RNA polymerase sigma factor [Deltaproteobacteria bacterium]
MSDELWAALQRWHDGDVAAGSEVIDEVFPRMARFFRNKVTRVPDDDDLTQKTMLALARARPRSPRGSFWGLVYGIANNVLREYVRDKHKRVREQADFATVCTHDLDRRSVSSVAVRSRELRAFVEGLRRLPVADQVLLELRYFEGLGAREIAEVLDMPQGSVHRKVQSGVERLRTIVAEQLDATGAGSGQAGAEATEAEPPSAQALQAWAKAVRDRLG